MKINWWNSLQVKIIAWSFVPIVIILAGVAWFTFNSNQKVIIDAALKEDQTIVQEKMGQVTAAIGGIIDTAIIPVIMEIDTNHDAPLEVRAQNIVDHAQGLEIFDGGLYFLDQNGVIYKTWPDLPELLGQDWSGTPQFRAVQAAPNIAVFSDLMPLESTGKMLLCTGAAMLGKDVTAVGVVYYCFSVIPASQNAYYAALANLDLGSNVYVTDRYLQVIYSTETSTIGQEVSGAARIQQQLQATNQGGSFRDENDGTVVSYAPVLGALNDQWGWLVVKEQSWREIMRPYLPSLQLLFALLALGVIAPVVVTAYGVRHITNPIQKLMRAAKQVTAGQFKQRIEVKTGDEIEALADQFNLMSAKLDDSYASLEKKVADRTRELAVMNAIISVSSHSLDIREVLEEALNKTVEQMGFDAGAAFRLEASPAPTLISCLGFEQSNAIDLLERVMLASQGKPAVPPAEVAALKVEAPQVYDQAGPPENPGYELLVSVPLTTKGHCLGLFLLGSRDFCQLSVEEISLLTAIGQQVGVAMENARLYEEAEQAAIAAERHRLARELHDAVTQTLFSANLIADVVPRIWKRSPEEGMQNLEELRQLTRGALAEMRTMLLEMRPESLEKADLKTLLTQLADAFIGRVRVPVSLLLQGDCELAQEVKLVFYRVAQEAMNNVAKHSGARQVEMSLECKAQHLVLCIKDDGLGFEPKALPPGHMGISIMRERASSIGASLKIESQVGLGTSVELEWKPVRKDGNDG